MRHKIASSPKKTKNKNNVSTRISLLQITQIIPKWHSRLYFLSFSKSAAADLLIAQKVLATQ